MSDNEAKPEEKPVEEARIVPTDCVADLWNAEDPNAKA